MQSKYKETENRGQFSYTDKEVRFNPNLSVSLPILSKYTDSIAGDTSGSSSVGSARRRIAYYTDRQEDADAEPFIKPHDKIIKGGQTEHDKLPINSAVDDPSFTAQGHVPVSSPSTEGGLGATPRPQEQVDTNLQEKPEDETQSPPDPDPSTRPDQILLSESLAPRAVSDTDCPTIDEHASDAWEDDQMLSYAAKQDRSPDTRSAIQTQKPRNPPNRRRPFRAVVRTAVPTSYMEPLEQEGQEETSTSHSEILYTSTDDDSFAQPVPQPTRHQGVTSHDYKPDTMYYRSYAAALDYSTSTSAEYTIAGDRSHRSQDDDETSYKYFLDSCSDKDEYTPSVLRPASSPGSVRYSPRRQSQSNRSRSRSQSVKEDPKGRVSVKNLNYRDTYSQDLRYRMSAPTDVRSNCAFYDDTDANTLFDPDMGDFLTIGSSIVHADHMITSLQGILY